MNYKFVLPRWAWGVTIFQIFIMIAFKQVSILAVMLCMWIGEGRFTKEKETRNENT
jgi:hypothetical protein